MTPEEIKTIVAEAIKDGIAGAFADPALHCRYSISPTQHDDEHEAIRKFMKLMGRIEDMKWGIIQKLVVGILGVAFTLMVIGAAAKLKFFGGLGWPGR